MSIYQEFGPSQAPPVVAPSITDSVLTFVQSKYEHSRDKHNSYHGGLKELYNLYRCIFSGKPLPYKNKVMLPLTFAAVWSDVALKIQTSLGQYPYIEFEGDSPDDGPSCRRMTSLVNSQWDRARIIDKMVDFLSSADIYGTGLWRHGWSHTSRLHNFRQSTPYGEMVTQKLVTEIDQPDGEVLDLLDFFPQPGPKRIHDMAWFVIRFCEDLDDIEEKVMVALAKGETPIYSLAAVRQLKALGTGHGSMGTDYSDRLGAYRNFNEWQSRRMERYAKPVEMLEYWGLVPDAFAPDGVRFRVITVAESKVIMRNEGTPYWHLQKPVIAFSPMPDPHSFFGIGKAEIGKRLAAAANKLVSGRVDAVELFLGPAFFASKQLNLGGNSLALWPGRVIGVDGTLGPDRLQPIQPDLRGTQLVFEEVNALSRYLQQGHGLHEDTLQGLASSDRQTAREFLGRMEQGRTRIGLESRLFEINMLEPYAEVCHKLNRQFLSAPRWIKTLGVGAHMDINTGLPMPPEPEVLSLDDLNADFRPRAKGATELLSKSMKRQDMMTALQAISTNQMGMQLTNWNSFFNRFWRTFDFDPNEMQVSQIPGLNMLGMNASQPNGMDALGAMQNSMPSLNPAQLGIQIPGTMAG